MKALINRILSFRPVVILINFFYLFVILWFFLTAFFSWLKFYIKLFYYKASKPLWRA